MHEGGDAPGRSAGGGVLIWGLWGSVLWIVKVLCVVQRRRDDLEGTGKEGISRGESDGSGGNEEGIIVDIKVHLDNSRLGRCVVMQN